MKPCLEGLCDPLKCTEQVCLEDLKVPEHEQIDEWAKNREPNPEEWGNDETSI